MFPFHPLSFAYLDLEIDKRKSVEYLFPINWKKKGRKMNCDNSDLDSSFGPLDSTLVLSQESQLSEITSPPGSPSNSEFEEVDQYASSDHSSLQPEGYFGEFLMALNNEEHPNPARTRCGDMPMFEVFKKCNPGRVLSCVWDGRVHLLHHQTNDSNNFGWK